MTSESYLKRPARGRTPSSEENIHLETHLANACAYAFQFGEGEASIDVLWGRGRVPERKATRNSHIIVIIPPALWAEVV